MSASPESSAVVADLLKELEEARGKKRRVQTTVTICSCLLFVGFLVLLYSQLTSVDTKKLEGALEEEAAVLVPQVRTAANQVFQTTWPIYYREIQNRMPELRPRLQSVVQRQKHVLSTNVRKRIEMNVAKTVELLNYKRENLETIIPDLKDKQVVESAMARLERDLRKELGAVVGETFDQHIVVLYDIQQSIEAIGKDAPDSAYDRDSIALLGLGMEVIGNRLQKEGSK